MKREVIIIEYILSFYAQSFTTFAAGSFPSKVCMHFCIPR
jgi:hypothetical protein